MQPFVVSEYVMLQHICHIVVIKCCEQTYNLIACNLRLLFNFDNDYKKERKNRKVGGCRFAGQHTVNFVGK